MQYFHFQIINEFQLLLIRSIRDLTSVRIRVRMEKDTHFESITQFKPGIVRVCIAWCVQQIHECMFKCIAHPQLIALTHPPPYMPIDFVFVRLYMIIFISPFLSRNNGVAQFLFYQSAEKLYVTDVLHDMFKEPNNNKTTYTHTPMHTGRQTHIRTGMHACIQICLMAH